VVTPLPSRRERGPEFTHLGVRAVEGENEGEGGGMGGGEGDGEEGK